MRYHHRALSRTLLIAPLLAMALPGCESGRKEGEHRDRPRTGAAQEGAPVAQRAEGEKAAATTTVDQVKEKPASFYDKPVRVTGEVDRIFADRAFDLEGTGWAFNDNITVLTRTPVAFVGGALARKDELIVSGTVRRFVTAELERDLGWDLTPEIEVHLKERPVLVAESIRKVGESGSWSAEPTAARPVAAVLTIITAVDTSVLAGQKVDLERERVQSVMGKGLWIGPSSMSQVYVVPDELPPGIQAGDLVRVTGTVQKIPKDATRLWNLTPDLGALVREENLFIDDAKVTEVPASGA